MILACCFDYLNSWILKTILVERKRFLKFKFKRLKTDCYIRKDFFPKSIEV